MLIKKTICMTFSYFMLSYLFWICTAQYRKGQDKKWDWCFAGYVEISNDVFTNHTTEISASDHVNDWIITQLYVTNAKPGVGGNI
jgi:hypothetical protein